MAFSTDALEVQGAGDESTTTETTDPDETSTTESDETSTTEPDETSTSAPGATQPTTSPATGTSAPADSFEALLATQCAGQQGQPVLAEELEELRGDDGSRRIVQILATCDVVFTGDVVVDLGRPSTNVEAMIDDPANDVTPNEAQVDALNSELALYWRIAEDVLAQAGLGDSTNPPTTPPSVETIQPATSAGTEPSTSVGSSTSSSTTP